MYKVIRIFRDKYTKCPYAIGDSFESADPDRVEDLLDRKLIEDVPEKVTSSIADHNEYQLMTKNELTKVLAKRGIEFNKRLAKDELIGLLMSKG